MPADPAAYRRAGLIDPERRSFVLAEAAYAAAFHSGDAEALAREEAKAWERVDAAARYLRTRPATRHVSPPGLPPQPTWEPKRTGVRAALARLLDVLMGRPG